MLGRRRADTIGTPFMTTLPQETWTPWTATIGTTTPGSGRTRAAWSASNDTACMVGREGNGHDVGPAAWDGQVVEDHPSKLLQRIKQPSSSPLPRRPTPPGDGVWAGSEPQPPASRHSLEPAEDQYQPRRDEAAERSGTGTDPQDGDDPPEEGPGPRGPLSGPHLPPLRLGGAARPAYAGPHPHRHHRPVRTGAGQQLVGVVAEVSEDGLQVGLGERLHRAAGPVVVVDRSGPCRPRCWRRRGWVVGSLVG